MTQSVTMSIIDDVTDCVIAHYSERFHKDDILSDTDIKARFNFNSGNWAAEAEALSELSCIADVGVRIPQVSMNANTTPEKIARLVKKLVDAMKAKAPASANLALTGKKKRRQTKKSKGTKKTKNARKTKKKKRR